MGFNIFQQNTLVDPSSMMDNFYHIGEGDMLPRGGTSLSSTSGVYDLGNNDNKYAEIHVQNVNISGELSSAWNLISRTELANTSMLIEIADLSGDTDEIYNIIFRGVIGTAGASGLIYMSVGGSTGSIITGTNYGYQTLNATGTTVVASRSTTNAGFVIGRHSTGITTSSELVFADVYLYAKTGNERMTIADSLNNASGDYVPQTYLVGGILSDTTATITSIKFWGAGASTTFYTGTIIEVWSKR